MLQAASLSKLARIRHAFFTRSGGVSQGVYASLNGGVGSNDAPDKVAENRARMAAALGVAPDRLLTAYQIHSPDVVVADEPWTRETRPRADAIVTRTPGLAIGVSTADCGPLLFADAEARVIGAAHAGWRGALTGVIEATIAAMEKLGAERSRIAAALGPTIRQPNYEVGPEFVERFLAADADNARFFAPVGARRPRHVRSHRLYRRPRAARRHRRFRGPRPVHLCRARALLQLSPHHPAAASPITAAISTRSHSPIDGCPQPPAAAIRRSVLDFAAGASLPRTIFTLGRGTVKDNNKARSGASMQWSSGGARLARHACRHGPACAGRRHLRAGAGRLQCRGPAEPTCRSAQPRGATVAFESIDGPPPGQFQHAGARSQRRGAGAPAGGDVARKPSAYRVRGYLAAKVEQEQHHDLLGLGRVRPATTAARLRITGEETANGRHGDAWTAADDDMLRRIARTSMDQLAAFLTSPEVAPGTPDVRPASRRLALGRTAAIPRPKRPAFSASSTPMPIRSTRETAVTPRRRRRRRRGPAAAPPAAPGRRRYRPGKR